MGYRVCSSVIHKQKKLLIVVKQKRYQETFVFRNNLVNGVRGRWGTTVRMLYSWAKPFTRTVVKTGIDQFCCVPRVPLIVLFLVQALACPCYCSPMGVQSQYCDLSFTQSWNSVFP